MQYYTDTAKEMSGLHTCSKLIHCREDVWSTVFVQSSWLLESQTITLSTISFGSFSIILSSPTNMDFESCFNCLSRRNSAWRTCCESKSVL